MRKRIIALIIAIVMAVTLVPFAEVGANKTVRETITSNTIRNINGWDVETWNQDGIGTPVMTLYTDGSFACTWSNTYNTLFRTGKKWGKDNTRVSSVSGIEVKYNITDYTSGSGSNQNGTNGTSYMGVYGWTTPGSSASQTVEYYIMDNWVNWRPQPTTSGYTSHGTITVDGGTYDIITYTRVNEPSIHSNNDTFLQIFSIRREANRRNSGTINVSSHFNTWIDKGLLRSNDYLYEVAMKIEGFGGSARSSGKGTLESIYLKYNSTVLCSHTSTVVANCTYCGTGTPPLPTGTLYDMQQDPNFAALTGTGNSPSSNNTHVLRRSGGDNTTTTAVSGTSSRSITVTGRTGTSQGAQIRLNAIEGVAANKTYKFEIKGRFTSNASGRQARLRFETGSSVLQLVSLGTNNSFTLSVNRTGAQIQSDIAASSANAAYYSIGCDTPTGGAFPNMEITDITVKETNEPVATTAPTTTTAVTTVAPTTTTTATTTAPLPVGTIYNMQSDPNFAALTGTGASPSANNTHVLRRNGGDGTTTTAVEGASRKITVTGRTGTSQGAQIRLNALTGIDSGKTYNFEVIGSFTSNTADRRARMRFETGSSVLQLVDLGANGSFTLSVNRTGKQIQDDIAASSANSAFYSIGCNSPTEGPFPNIEITSIIIKEVSASSTTTPAATTTPTPTTTTAPPTTTTSPITTTAPPTTTTVPPTTTTAVTTTASPPTTTTVVTTTTPTPTTTTVVTTTPTPTTSAAETTTTSPHTTTSSATTEPNIPPGECENCGECNDCPVIPGHIRSNNNDIGIADALEVLMYLAKIDSSLIVRGGEGSRPWKAACITSISQKNNKPSINDALQILMYLVYMPSYLGERTS